jgi:hypothetical protein
MAGGNTKVDELSITGSSYLDLAMPCMTSEFGCSAIEYRSEGKRRSLRLGDVADAEIEGLPGQDGGDVTIGNHPFTGSGLSGRGGKI